MSLHGLSDRFLAAVKTNQTLARQVLVVAPNGDEQDVTEFMTGGSVNVDETREIRRTATFTPSGDPDLVPSDASDLFHPASGNDIVVKRGVQYDDGTTEMATLGTFRSSKPVFTDSGAIAGTLNLNDRASVISRIDWQKPFVVPAGNNIGAVLAVAMQTRLPPGMSLDYSQINDSIPFSYPATTWGTDPSQKGDPMQDFITFAAAAGCELFFDPVGDPVLRQINNPLTSTIVDSLSFVEGPDALDASGNAVGGEGLGLVNQVVKTMDETTAYNGVMLFCNGVGAVPPFVVSVWNTDPTSPSYYLGKWGQVPYKITTTAIPSGSDSLVTAQSKALTYAYGQLQLVLSAFNDVTVNVLPNPALREGDCVAVGRSRMGVSGGFVISNFTMPMDLTTPVQSIGFRPRVTAK